MPFGVRTSRQAAAATPQQIALSELSARLESVYYALDSGHSIKQRYANLIHSAGAAEPPPQSEVRHLHSQERIQGWSFPLQDGQNGEGRDQGGSMITLLNAQLDKVNVLPKVWFCDDPAEPLANAGNHVGKGSPKNCRREWIDLPRRCPEVAFNLVLVCYWRPCRADHQ
jgi:hypothetical protein